MAEVNPTDPDQQDIEDSSGEAVGESQNVSVSEETLGLSSSLPTEESAECHFDKLDDDTIINVLQRLDFRDYCKCSKVCTRWNWISKEYNIVQILDLKLSKISPEDVESLVTYHRTLKLYDLTLQDIESYHYDSLKMLLKNAPNLRKLILLMGKFNLSERRFADNVQFDIRFLPSSIVHLSLRGCNVNLKNFFGVNPSDYLPNLRCLDLGFAYMDTSSESIHTFNKMDTLHSLYLDACYHLAHSNLKSLVESGWYDFSFMTNLKVLDLEGIVLIPRTITFLIQNCKFLEELYLGQGPIRDQAFTDVSRKDLLIRTLCVINTKTTAKVIARFFTQTKHTNQIILHHNWEDKQLANMMPRALEGRLTLRYRNTNCCFHVSNHRCNE